MKPSRRAFLSKCFPMNTNLFSRVPSPHTSFTKPPEKSIPTPWKTNFSFLPATERTPLYRKRLAPILEMISSIHMSSFLTFKKPSNFVLMEDTEGSCSCSPSVLRNSGSISSVFCKLKDLIPISFMGSTLLCWHRMICAVGFSSLIRFSIAGSSVSSTRSVLFNRMRSANAICSAASFSTPSGFSSSRREMMCLASVTVMMPSRVYFSLTSSSTKKV
mmetsp:Transcript_32008/g.38747  ORF Transcript_32008/g.38747 Transcript_32008/m.38747 type:complete len:217 (+) Transcript_32008:603-1253(+)